jgi:hypothetical protein
MASRLSIPFLLLLVSLLLLCSNLFVFTSSVTKQTGPPSMLRSQSQTPDADPAISARNAALEAEVLSLKSQLSVPPPSSQYKPATSLQQQCDTDLGMGLVEKLIAEPVVVCDGGDSRITCYPVKHPWEPKRHWHCVGEGVTVDFGKVKGGRSDEKPPRGAAQYHTFEPGSVSAACTKTGRWGEVQFMPHHAAQMASFRDGVEGGGEREATPT